MLATVVNIAVWGKRPRVNVNRLMYNEVQYIGAALYDEDAFLKVIDAMEDGRLQPRSMITAKVPLEKVRVDGFQALLKDRDEHCKVIVDVQGQGA